MIGALTWEIILQDSTVLGLLGLFSSVLLIVIAGPVFMGLLPVVEPQRMRIAYALLDVGTLGSMAMSCFIMLPSLALKLWRLD
uniref:Uncharacterized protein n=1 Tax=Setaria italica TaxID=4555 RepID=K3YLW9_SETIT